MANPPVMKVFTVDRHGLRVEGFMSSRTRCVVQSPPLVFAPNRAFECGPLLGLQVEESRRAQRPKRLSVRRGRLETAASRVSGLYVNQPVSATQPSTFNSRQTKPQSSLNCKQHRLGELGRHGGWN